MSRVVAKGLRCVLGGRNVLDGVDLELNPGSFTLLAGCNGAGKTTLLMILASVARPDEGSVELDSVSLTSLPHRERARTITLIPQDADCPFEFTGRELVAMGRHPHMWSEREPERSIGRPISEFVNWPRWTRMHPCWSASTAMH